MTEHVPEPLCRIDEVFPSDPNRTYLRYIGPWYDYTLAPHQAAIVRHPDATTTALGSVASGESLYDFLCQQGAFTETGGLCEVDRELAHFKALCVAPIEEFLLNVHDKTGLLAMAILRLVQTCETEVERLKYSNQAVARLHQQLAGGLADLQL